MCVRRSSRSTAIRPVCGTRSSRCRCRILRGCRTSRTGLAGSFPMPAGRGARVVRRSSRWPRATRRSRDAPCAGGTTSRSPSAVCPAAVHGGGAACRAGARSMIRRGCSWTALGRLPRAPLSRNMNGWPSRMRLRIMRRALTSLWYMSFTLPQSTTWFACT